MGEDISEIINSFGVALFQSLENWYGEPSAQKERRFRSESAKVGLDPERAERLWRRHGTAAFQCVEKMRRDPKMTERVIGDCPRAELHLIAEKEMVIRLEDFLRRRTRLALTQHKAALRCDPGLEETARVLFGEHAQKAIDDYFA